MSDRTPQAPAMSSALYPRCLRAEDAIELAELLEFLGRWLEYVPGALGDALEHFCGPSYVLGQIGADLARFTLLLDGNSDRPIFSDDR